MKSSRPLRYEILDPHETPPPRRRRRRSRGHNHKTVLFHGNIAAIGQYLRACRLRPGRNGRGVWSLRSVANRAEINHSLLSQGETGKRRLVADDLLRLADVLGEDREALLVRAGYLPAASRAHPAIDRLTAAERQWLAALRTQPQLWPLLEALLPAKT